MAPGPVGDASSFADLPGSAKLILTLYMLPGRLELLTFSSSSHPSSGAAAVSSIAAYREIASRE